MAVFQIHAVQMQYVSIYLMDIGVSVTTGLKQMGKIPKLMEMRVLKFR